MSINVNDKNLGHATAYAYYKAGGGTMTEAEFTEFMADFGTASQTAVEAAQAALASKNAAQTAATTATNKASEATTAATTATNKAAEAQADADAAALDASQALSAASTATTKATEATTAAATATSAATTATTAKDDAVSAKTAAQTAQTGAETAAASVEASAAQIATNAADISQLKSEFTALESDGVVPSAEQILSDKGITDSVPYHYRKTGGDGADREYVDAIVGGTVNWNQLVQNGNFESLTGWIVSGGTVSGNVVTFPVQSVNGWDTTLYRNKGTTGGHKFVAIATVKTTVDDMFRFRYPNISNSKSITANIWTTFSAIITISNNGDRIGLQFAGKEGGEYSVKNFMLFDLAAMFGSTIADYIYQLEQTTAGAGVAFFKALFPNDYYPYNSGELVSVSGLSEHKTVGFNLFDEVWEKTLLNPTGGVDAIDGRRTTKNFIRILPNTQYCIKLPQAGRGRGAFYNSDKSLISYYADFPGTGAESVFPNNGNLIPTTDGVYFVFVTPANAQWFKYSAPGINIVNVCINLSDPAKNGTYEPYKAHSYSLDNTLTLRGLFKLDANSNLYADGDTYDADGTVTRKYGIVDLGTLNWNKINGSGSVVGYQTSGVQNIKPNSSDSAIANIVCSAFKPSSVNNGYSGVDKECITENTFGRVTVYTDGGYADGNAFKTAMTGQTFVYELATPTTEEAEPYQHLQQCDPNGTEEYVSAGIVPIGHNSFYPENLRAKVEQLPWNFASLIAPTESTFTATRNYTTGSLFIVDNVLYKATSNIANGGTITPNTNCTATTLAEIISALA